MAIEMLTLLQTALGLGVEHFNTGDKQVIQLYAFFLLTFLFYFIEFSIISNVLGYLRHFAIMLSIHETPVPVAMEQMYGYHGDNYF